MTCAEIVTFRLNQGVSDTDYLAVAHAASDWLKAQPGFVFRRLSRTEDGLWTDYLEWQKQSDADAAGAIFMEQTFAQAMMGLTDASSLAMRTEPVLLAA